MVRLGLISDGSSSLWLWSSTNSGALPSLISGAVDAEGALEKIKLLIALAPAPKQSLLTLSITQAIKLFSLSSTESPKKLIWRAKEWEPLIDLSNN
ncbi:MAG: hypothetical protein FJ126_11640 [Deltaproteobacteria bacterium]|nr:hypothetical protein [Deltaproteobacteria bacterium]